MSYQSVYGTNSDRFSPFSRQKPQAPPTLRAYDIDLSIRIDATTSNITPRLGKVTCTFDDAPPNYSTSCPTSSTTSPKMLTSSVKSPGSERRYHLQMPNLVVKKPTVIRRRTMGPSDEPTTSSQNRRDKTWYSSSVDSVSLSNSSSLPRNFLRKPTQLHSAEQVESIPYIDEDIQETQYVCGAYEPETTPPAKPSRSYQELDNLPVYSLQQIPISKSAQNMNMNRKQQAYIAPMPSSFEKSRISPDESWTSLRDEPRTGGNFAERQIVDQNDNCFQVSARPIQIESEDKNAKFSAKPFNFTKKSFISSNFPEPKTEIVKPFVRACCSNDKEPGKSPGIIRKVEKPIPEQERRPDERSFAHLREDSGYKSDRKSSIDLIDHRNSSTRVQKNPENFEFDSENEEFLEDFDWGDEYLNRRRCSLVVRTQTNLRVKTIIDKLLNSSGRDQRRALFSLKQIFQDDKDLVHEFVRNGGLDCMIRLGRTADQNHQNYILRALGQLMLYVDGMNGIIAHNETIQWLYELLDSPFRLVVKTALKLLLVFIEYNDNNSLLVITAISIVDKSKGVQEWSALMKVILEKDSPDPETQVFAMTVINKALHGIPDRDTYYDAVDSLETLGMEEALKNMGKSTCKELQEQCRLYERELNQEDERADNDDDVAVMRRSEHRRSSVDTRSISSSYHDTRDDISQDSDSRYVDARDSESGRQVGTLIRDDESGYESRDGNTTITSDDWQPEISPNLDVRTWEPEGRHDVGPSESYQTVTYEDSKDHDDNMSSRRSSKSPNRYSNSQHDMPEDIESALEKLGKVLQMKRDQPVKHRDSAAHESVRPIENSRKDIIRRRYQDARARQEEHMQFAQAKTLFNGHNQSVNDITPAPPPPPWRQEIAQISPTISGKTSPINRTASPINNGDTSPKLKRIPEPINLVENQENQQPVTPQEDDHIVKAPPPSFPTLFSPTEAKTMEFPDVSVQKEPEPEKPPPPKAKIERSDGNGDSFAALLQKRAAKSAEANRAGFEKKESEAELQWKKAAENLKSRPLIINDLDFSEFHAAEFEQDPLMLARCAKMAEERETGTTLGIPPPPPSMASIPLPPRLQGLPGSIPPAPPLGFGSIPPPPNLGNNRDGSPSPGTSQSKGVLKLHWKPASVEPPPVPALKKKGGTFWHVIDSQKPNIDANKLVQLFETKHSKEQAIKKVNEVKPQVLSVLSIKRSQAINIGLTKLPPINVIPTAIMKFDSLVLNKECIEKILKEMMPVEKEIEQIELKAAENPDMTLGNAEQFLVKLAQIPCLLERLKLWIFTLDYKNCEKDIAEPLMDLQLGMKEMEESKTFKVAMGMLLAIGNSLSGTGIKGFYLDYLTKASEVKDPVYKHTLTYHLAEYMVEHYPEGTDLYSEFGAVARASRIDYKELLENLMKLEKDCKSSWEYLTKISKNDQSSMRQKINDYLTDVAQRIHQLKAIYTVTKNRWHAFLLFFGYSVEEIPNQNPNEVFKMVTEFALEYRTTRDKILQQRKRMAEKRERNKTRGKIWALENGGGEPSDSSMMVRRRPPPLNNSQQRHEELMGLLSNGFDDGTLRRRGARPPPNDKSPLPKENGDESPEDEILNGLVKAATLQSEVRDHRRKARQFNRKSLRRTRTLRLVDGELETSNY